MTAVDAFKIAVSIGLTNTLTPALTNIASQAIGANNAVNLLNKSLGRLQLAGIGLGAIFASTSIFRGMQALAKHGADVNHQLELMKIAGMQNADIQRAMSAATATAASNTTTHLSENLAHIRELRYAFGDTATAIKHLDEVSKANTILNAVKGGGTDQVWELVKSLEGKGLTFDPKAFSSYVDTMTKVVAATGGKVTPQMFMSTFKYGRTATLGWDEGFVGGALPRLMQSMATGSGGSGGAGGPGNALMSAFAKVVQGQMPKTAAEEFARMGLTPGGIANIKGSAQTQVKGGIAGRDLFMANPYEWVQQVLMPALAKNGVTREQDIIAQISKMFPVRTASQVITEMATQGRFREGEHSPFEKDIAIQKGAMGQAAAFDELLKNDYPTVMKAFHEQFHNLLEVLGSPLIQPGGPVLSSLSSLTSIMSSMSQFASAHPEGVKIALEAIVALMAGLAGAGLAALAVALAPLIGPAGLIAGVVLALGALATFNWSAISSGLNAVYEAISGFIGKIKGAIGIDGVNRNPRMQGGNNLLQKQNFEGDGITPNMLQKANWMPPGRNDKPIVTTATLNIDGRQLAEVVSEQIARLGEFTTQAPYADGRSAWWQPDSQVAAT